MTNMRLLIIAENAEDIANTIDWNDAGIDEVTAVSDAMAARAAFKHAIPDILLSEIELPVENGITFYQWVKEMDYSTRAVFITNSSFDYVKDAFAAGADDYLQKPVSLEKIKETVSSVARTIEKIAIQEKNDRVAGLTKDREQMIVAGLWRGYLTGVLDTTILSEYREMPEDLENLYLVLAHVVHMSSTDEKKWDSRLLQNALKNIVEEVFDSREYKCLIVMMQPLTFSITLQRKSEPSEDEKKKISKLLNYLCGVCNMYMPFKLDCYCEGPHLSIAELPDAWNRLLTRKNASVIHRGNVCWYQPEEMPLIDKMTGTLKLLHLLKEWQRLARDGKLTELENLIKSTLDDMSADNTLTKETLLEFHQGFLQTIMAADEEGVISGLFEREEIIDLYRRSVDDADYFLEFVHAIVLGYQSNPEQMSHRDMVHKIVEYIHMNIGNTIHQNNISELVMVNPDYANRIFKKETGQSIKAYITQEKMNEARRLLRTTQLPISYIASHLGFTNFSHFSASYKKQMNRTPQEERHLVEKKAVSKPE